MITAENLSFSYGLKSSSSIFKRLNLKIPEGHICGLLGPNGAGKTTLLSLLAGLKRPSAGSLTLDETTPFRREPDFLGTLYYLPAIVEKTGERASAFASARSPFWPGWSKDIYLSLLDMFEVKSEKKLSEMSEGELKKAHIAFAVSCQTRYLLMDEPTNGLDISSKSQFRKAVAAHSAENATVIIATHQIADVENLLDWLILLDRGSLLLSSSMEDSCRIVCFDYGTAARPDAIWVDQGLSGSVQICPNREGVETRCCVEALYNAFHHRKEAMLNLFDGKNLF